jgi:TonB-dependent receptor
MTATTVTNDSTFIYYRYGGRQVNEKSYTNALPSAQAKYTVSKNLIFKAAYYKSLMRPDHNNLKGGVVVNDNTAAPFAFTRANINLDPETADNFEVGVEYYFKQVGLVSFNVWNKKLKDIQIDNTSFIDPAAVPEDIAELGFAGTDLGAQSTITQRINAGGTEISGAEFNYEQQLTFLPGLLKGTGVKYNISYVQPKDQQLFSSSAAAQTASGGGIPAWTQNFQVNWKYKAFEIRFTTNYNTKKVLATNGVTFDATGQPVYAAAGVQKDIEAGHISYSVNTSYRLNKYAVLFLNAQNITNEHFYRYKVSYMNTLRDGDYGAVYNLGVKGNF